MMSYFLDWMYNNYNLEARFMKRLTLLLTCFMISMGLAIAQNTNVRGVVVDESGEPIIGASVIVKGNTSLGVVTDIDGKFSLSVPASATTLVVKYLGMEDQEVAVAPNVQVNMRLEATALDEVIVVAYGTTKKSSFTGSASTVGSAMIESRPVSNVTKMLEGVTSGIQVTSGSGQPGEGVTMRIRGTGSVNASNSPLIVLDGFPYNGNIGDINPNDIESISVLKDASSAALYGSRAANGVVMVTTKKGKTGSLRVNLRATQGISSRGVPEYDRIGPYEYVPIMWESMRNALIGTGKTPEQAAKEASAGILGTAGLNYNPFSVPDAQVMNTDGTMNPNAKLLYDDFAWEDEMTRMGQRSEVLLNVNGGTDKVKYLFSAGYLDDKGYLIETDFERFSLKAAVDASPKKWLNLGADVSNSIVNSAYSTSDADNSTGYANAFFFTRNIAPIYPVYKHNADGSFTLDELGNKIYEWDKRPFSPGRHIVAETKWNDRSRERNALNSRAYAEFLFLNGFRLKLSAGADIVNNYDGEMENKKVGDGSPQGRSRRTYEKKTTWNFNQILTYEKRLNEVHNINVLAGHESYAYTRDYFYGIKQGVIMPDNPELINYTTTNDLRTYYEEENIEGYFTRINYDYKDKYYVSASYRRDGSSRFSKDNRWGDFWSVGGSWRIDQEDFFSVSWLNSLKLRAAYGETGNSGILDSDGYQFYYPWQTLYSIRNNGTEAGFTQNTDVGNSNLTWEKSGSFDVALEFGMFNQRLKGELEFYNRVSDNLLFNVPLPISAGVQKQFQNVGTMFNRGFELTLLGEIIKKKDFLWTANVNITTLKNEVTKLPQKEIISGTKKWMVGHSIYDFWLRDYVGVNSDNGAVMFTLDEDPEKMKTYPAGSYYEHDGQLVTENQNYAKYDYHGTATPDFYGGFGTGFRYRGFDLSCLFTYQLGGQIYDTNYSSLMSSGDYGNAKHADILNRWTSPGDVTDVPRMDNGKMSAFGAGSSRWLTDASFLAFKSLSIGYNLPSNIVKKMDLSNLQVYVSGENLALFTKRKGLNPTQQMNGTIYNVYDPARVFTLGLNLSF